MSVLITAPESDITTFYLASYAKVIAEFAKSKGIKVFHLEREAVKREVFESILVKKKPALVLLNGHGSQTAIEGHKKEIILEEGINHQLLSGKLTYALSCWAASSLGKKATENAGCFIGYIMPFQFYFDSEHAANPNRDETAKLFLEPSNQLAISLIKGNSAEKASESFKSKSLKNISKLLKASKDLENLQLAKAIWMNLKFLKIQGNKDLAV